MTDKAKIPTAREREEQSIRQGIEDLLGYCTQTQKDFFFRMHENAPWKGYKNIPADKLHDSYDLLRRTAIANS